VIELPLALDALPATKFTVPRPRPEHITRSRCLALLDGPPSPHHVLICATAGAGKTTLAAQIAREGPRAAWVSLAPTDDTAPAVLGSIILGLRRAIPAFGQDGMIALLNGAPIDEVVRSVCNELLLLGRPLVLVLDDLHHVSAAECTTALQALLAYAPPCTRIVLTSRHVPELSVERLHVEGKLALLGTRDLRFDAQEVDWFLSDRLRLRLSPSELDQLQEILDGWAAGLYMASLSLRRGITVGELVDALDTVDGQLSDYLVAEALAHMEAPRVAFLEQLAVLGRFSAELCADVLERPAARLEIAELERANLFVIAEDASATWFRLHALFAAVLRRRGMERDPQMVPRLHEKAADWHRRHGNVAPAIDHLLAAGRYPEAAKLIFVERTTYARLSAQPAAQRWLLRFRPTVVAASPPLSLIAAWVAAGAGRRQEMDEHLERACSQRWRGELPDGSASPEAHAALLRASAPFGDASRALSQACLAARLERPRSPWWARIEYLVGLWTYLVDGPGESALSWLLAAGRDAVLVPASPAFVLAPAVAASVLLDLGRAAEGEELLAISLGRHGASDPPLVGAASAHAFRARVLRRLHRFIHAEREIEAGLRATRGLRHGVDPTFNLSLLRIEATLVAVEVGALREAHEHLAVARASLAGATDPGLVGVWLADAELAVTDHAGAEAAPLDDAGWDAALSDREVSVLRMLAGPLTLGEIGDELRLSRNTIKAHATSIYRKLDVTGRPHAVAMGRRLSLIP
jgi:LuxR family maltose regulon positive regulatory protein